MNQKVLISLGVLFVTLILALFSTATITDAISAVATVILVYVAWQANKTWRNEFNYEAVGKLQYIFEKIKRELDPKIGPSIGCKIIRDGSTDIQRKDKLLEELENIFFSKECAVFFVEHSVIKEKTSQLLKDFKLYVLNIWDIKDYNTKISASCIKEQKEYNDCINEMYSDNKKLKPQIIEKIIEIEKSLLKVVEK
jgi:hypothetical protein